MNEFVPTARDITVETVLVYYDAPQILIASDRVDTKYLCMLVQQSETELKFLCVSVTPERLVEIETGRLDFRKAFESPEIAEYYTSVLTCTGREGVSSVLEYCGDRVEPSLLPRAGVHLTPERTLERTCTHRKDNECREAGE